MKHHIPITPPKEKPAIEQPHVEIPGKTDLPSVITVSKVIIVRTVKLALDKAYLAHRKEDENPFLLEFK